MKKDISTLKEEAKKNRKKILEMVYKANAGHPGGSLSVVDILTAIYANEVDFTAKKRSRVVLSKGHATPALYAVLNQLGFIDKSEFDKGIESIKSCVQKFATALNEKNIHLIKNGIGYGESWFDAHLSIYVKKK